MEFTSENSIYTCTCVYTLYFRLKKDVVKIYWSFNVKIPYDHWWPLTFLKLSKDFYHSQIWTILGSFKHSLYSVGLLRCFLHRLPPGKPNTMTTSTVLLRKRTHVEKITDRSTMNYDNVKLLLNLKQITWLTEDKLTLTRHWALNMDDFIA